ncbi:MAG: GH1 family beta-glucosidase [Nakamurella sp.]
MNSEIVFPDGFVWGAATSSYQIEGAAAEDGRTASIWDTFCRMPGRVLNGDTGDVACDHYHRMEEDLDLMAGLGLKSYRFSTAWPRIVPNSSGAVEQRGLDFYSRLVDGLLVRGIEPMVTLYHWDLPQSLQDVGGWANRETANRFAEYAAVVGTALGDRVSTFLTLNEPWCSAFLGYATGVHAPGLTDRSMAFTAAHHLNLAHGQAVTALRSVLPGGAQVGVTLNLSQVEPDDPDSPADLAASEHVVDIANRIFTEPMLRGRYPDRLFEQTRHLTDWSFVADGDLAAIASPIDVLGINYYQPARIKAPHGDTNLWPGTDLAASAEQVGPYTAMGWSIIPDGLTKLLVSVHQDYPEIPLMITENGCAFNDVANVDGEVHDPNRVSFLRGHLAAVHTAIVAGADVRGYYVWSLMDNFEWAVGYSARFGIVHVDFGNQRRTLKDSARWYRDVAAANALPEESEPQPEPRVAASLD